MAQHLDEPPDGLYQYDRTVNKRIPRLDAVTEEDLGFFQEFGYLVIDSFLSQDDIDAINDGMLTLLGDVTSLEPSLPDDVVQFESDIADQMDDSADVPPERLLHGVRKFWQFSDYSEPMRAPAKKGDLLDLLATLVDGKPALFQDMALIKPPGGREKPWHQDQAYFTVELDAPVVGVWIALDVATADNGCMHIIPGSHRDGPVVHFDRRDWQICDTDVQVDRDVMVPLEPGGVLLFDGLLHHGTPPNRSNRLRRALQFHYTAGDARWLDERDGAFGSSHPDVEC